MFSKSNKILPQYQVPVCTDKKQKKEKIQVMERKTSAW